MAQEPDEEEFEEKETRKPAGPRFGPFVTIAVAILMLFGAASRIGKTPDSGSVFNIDLLTSKNLEMDQQRQQERRNTTLITLGAVPTPIETYPRPQSLHLRENVLPPERNVDFNTYRDEQRRQQYGEPSPMLLSMPTEGNHHPGASESAPRFDPAPEARSHPAGAAESSMSTYTVAQGDTLAKIGKLTGKPWQDIQKANPQSMNGLRVGMKLVIP